MSLDRSNEIVGLAVGVLTLMGLMLGYVKVVRPRWRKFRDRAIGGLDALVGREAVHDSITGKEIAPALPGIGTRMETVEQAIEHIADLLTTQRTQDQQIAELREDLGQLTHRVKTLEDGAIERVAGKAESISAWRAVEAVAKNTDPTTPEIEEQP